MTSEDWWAVIVQGPVSALLGFVGVYVVYLATRRYDARERDKDRAREATERLQNAIRDLQWVSVGSGREFAASHNNVIYALEELMRCHLKRWPTAASWFRAPIVDAIQDAMMNDTTQLPVRLLWCSEISHLWIVSDFDQKEFVLEVRRTDLMKWWLPYQAEKRALAEAAIED